MSQRVPSWDLDDTPNLSHNLYPSSSSGAAPPRLSMSDYEVAELTWQNGHLSAPAPVGRTTPRHAAGDTLESIVNHAKLLHPSYATWHHPGGPHLTSAVDAVVPSTGRRRRRLHRGWDVDLASGIGSCDVSGDRGGGKRARAGETDDSGFASTNSVTPLPDDCNGVSGSPDTENTSFGGGGGSRPLTVADDHASVYHSRRSLSRKRRGRITQKIRTLQKLVPNSSKTDKASMLDEVIEYLQQLQAKVQMMRGMSSIPSMMMPVSMQQFQMTMMAQMGMGMGMGMMDMASLGRTGPASISPVMPAGAFLPMIAAARAWDPSAAAAAAERMQQPAAAGVMPDPFFAFVVCQPQQQMTMDAYQRMAALYQQMFQQNQPTNPK